MHYSQQNYINPLNSLQATDITLVKYDHNNNSTIVQANLLQAKMGRKPSQTCWIQSQQQTIWFSGFTNYLLAAYLSGFAYSISH